MEGQHLYKADPYANQAEMRPGTASVIWDPSDVKWTDAKWMRQREGFDVNKDPMVIYECHIGSWLRKDGRENAAAREAALNQGKGSPYGCGSAFLWCAIAAG